MSHIYASAHSWSTEEEETLADKQRRKKKKLQKKRNDVADKRRKNIEEAKFKAKVEVATKETT